MIGKWRIWFCLCREQLHWRNELRSTEHVDGSGVIMYYRDIDQTSGKSLAVADRPLKSTVIMPAVLIFTTLHFFVIAR